jgi:uncharacterized protein (TIGR03437 family)
VRPGELKLIFRNGLGASLQQRCAEQNCNRRDGDEFAGIIPIIVNGTNYAAAVFLDGKIAGDPAIGPGFRNAKPGEPVALFATGLVPTPAGVLPSLVTVSGVTATIGDITVPADFAGLVAVGEFQINFTVPQQFASRAAGNYPVSIQVNGVSSPRRSIRVRLDNW